MRVAQNTEITVESLLSATGISKGSLYHHFEDFDDLIAQADAKLFSGGVDRSIESISATLAGVENAEDFRLHVRELILDTLTPEGMHHRLIRARLLAASMKYPKLQQYISLEQHRLTNEISEILTRAKERGLVKMSVDTKVAAVFIQGYTFGKIIDDTSNAPVDSNDWTDWIMSILEYKILS